jgi:hypothetical protein
MTTKRMISIFQYERKRRRRQTIINKTLPRIPLNHDGEPRCSEGQLPFSGCSGRGLAFPQVFQKGSCLSSVAPEGALPFLFLLEKFEDTKEIIRSGKA